MIIEIKDLPQGRKVKHINVDITFEEDGVVVKTKTEPTDSGSVDLPKFDMSENTIPVSEPIEREHKEIPPEMTDMEF
jgi:hypothetical protein